ncbi:PmoA family protein [Aquiflexum gelatinilyticum]|uniref:PmoA family protein n=1 Tax=Aquiflexum gelatinilyticum TaxID=2961943 RepID=A0A9X2P5Z0_9BACT|nr:PmoA family protein [Aquiflexum gelatinilyticum]MCR9016751.1 PmoA family protein [Aquiflexum gelatinilyticum]
MIFKRLFYISLASFIFIGNAFTQNIIMEETSNGIDFKAAGQLLLTYQTAKAEVPAGVKPEFSKSGFIHPLASPSGQVLTRIQPPDHYHHYGIWGPWTKTTIEGREVDFWNLGDGKGRVDFEKVISKKTNSKFSELVVRQNHMDLLAPKGPQLALEEDLSIRVWNKEGERYLIDYSTTISTPLKSSVILEAYRYGGGIGFRATEKWDHTKSTILTSEGNDRKSADGTFAKWLIIQGESSAPSGQSGILFLSHPDNRSHPEPMRVWPEDSNEGKENVFLEFCPIRHESWEILPGKKYTLHYRMVVFDGNMTPEEAEEYWKSFSKK